MEQDYRALWDTFRDAAEPCVERFHRCHHNPREHQLRLLDRLIADAAPTKFGEAHQFSDIRSYHDFTQRVPIASWAEFEPWVKKATSSDGLILTTAAPLFFEPTSGSSAQRKLIPYTPQLLKEFQSAIIVWLASLYDACPDIANGRGYWSLSPQLGSLELSSNGIPVGCGSDMGYLANSIVVPLLQSVLNPPNLNSTNENWRVDSLVAMINASDLTMMSVWSPTFLLAMLQPLLSDQSQMAESNQSLIDAVRQGINTHRLPLYEKACEEANFSILWPQLTVLSTWTAGPSLSYSNQLAGYFPDAKLIPKGLLATEGVVSISYGANKRCPLALDSHFLEFIANDGSIKLADELKVGEHYKPLLTTSGGLYRYPLGDIVECNSADKSGLISVEFVGRADARSDLVGEKLDEGLAMQVLDGSLHEGMSAALVPNADGKPPNYIILIEGCGETAAVQISEQIEQALLAVHHYAQARQLGQLGKLEIRRVENVSKVLQLAWESLGKTAGDFKPSMLITSLPLAREISRASS